MRGIALLYLGLLLVLPVAMVFLRAFEDGLEPVSQAIGRPAFQSAFWLTVADHAHHRAHLHRDGRHDRARHRASRVSPAEAPERPRRPAIRPVAGRHRALAVPGLRHEQPHRLGSWPTTASASSSRCPGWSWRPCSCPCRSSSARSCRCCGRSAPTRRRRPTPSGAAAGGPSGGSPCRPIRWGIVYGIILTTARSLGEFGAVAIVSGKISGKTRRSRPCPGALSRLRHRGRLHRLHRARRDGAPRPRWACSSTSPGAAPGQVRRRTSRRACSSSPCHAVAAPTSGGQA